jgi:hypothetical protein
MIFIYIICAGFLAGFMIFCGFMALSWPGALIMALIAIDIIKRNVFV